MIDRKQIILISGVGLIALLFFILVIISAFLPKDTSKQEEQVTPTPEDVVVPTSSQSSIQNGSETSSLNTMQLISTTPPDGSIDLSPVEKIELQFTHPIKARAFYYQTNPQVSTLIRVEGSKVIISPKSVWNIGNNSISVFAQTESIDGQTLSTPFTYSFTTKDLPFPDEEIE